MKIARTWGTEGNLRGIRAKPDAGKAFLQALSRSVRGSKLEPLKKVALTLKDHLLGLLHYFFNPIISALAERFDSEFQAIKAGARGFRRFENYRYRILIHRATLDLLPALT